MAIVAARWRGERAAIPLPGAVGSGPAPRNRRGRVWVRAYGRGSSPSPDPDYYSLLGLDPDCEEEDIKAAFRRRAKELHPDINKEDDAHESFVQLSRAYEVLSDPEARRQYDITHRPRRMNFFRDVDDDDDGPSPFRWSHVGQRGGGRRSAARPFDDGSDDEEEGAGGEAGGEEGGARRRRRGAEDEEEEEGFPGARSPEEFLEQLQRVMGGPGSLRSWQSGRSTDPWGSSTSDTWFRQVERQTRSPYGPQRPGYGSSADEDEGGPGGREWGPARGVPGWTPPGRGSEWSHPRRQWDEEDRRGGGGPGPGRGGGGGGGDFRQPFKI
ncbi:hypothetical protein HYH03_013926 [Edaphochlamys debaryana]|uniref:J domain-containing protein n=1 Tax=Edaphochlamys debaryana TaxID=47281 RepID=A0A835XR97_9CHLO|nr:hypothetical protein HYH03_013926 [Edaphochlamys debaryana]|eukprot:KAG2487508.1 hypothetical protein HYH03_013926 [Edaphochlamys debaryana]